MIETILVLDGAVLLWIQENLRMDWLTPLILAVTGTGNGGMIWILLSLVLLCFKKTRKAGAAGLLGLLFSLLLNNLCLKPLIARTRPYEVVEGLLLLSERAADFSFPSGHTGSSFACAAAVCLILKNSGCKWRWLLLVYAALMGFTRLYIGIHYPTDVFCGFLTGTLCGYAAYRVIRLLENRKKKRETADR